MSVVLYFTYDIRFGTYFVLHFRICCVGMLPALSAGESAAAAVLKSVILSRST